MVSPQWDQNRFFDDFGPIFCPTVQKNRNFLTILVDTVGQNLILDLDFVPLCRKPKLLDNVSGHSGTKIGFGLFILSHCAENRNFLTILVDTVGQKLVLDCLFCPTVHKIETF